MVRDRDEATQLPTGTVTLLLADLEGSADPRVTDTEIRRLVDEEVSRLASAHHGARPLQQADAGFLIAFGRASDAVACALGLQRALGARSWPGDLDPIVRMALHTGEVELHDDATYGGPAVDRCAAIRELGGGGQVLLSRSASDLVLDSLPMGASLIDLGVHELRGMWRPEQVFQLRHETLRPGGTLVATGGPGDLPQPPTSFVGRSRELPEIDRLLSRTRVLTLVGAGGSGKTRLAIEAARRGRHRQDRDLVWIDLAAVQSSQLVLPTIVSAVGASPQPGQEPLQALIEQLDARRALLVFDNCEHLTEVVASVVAALAQAAPGVRVLATSREPLGVEGETTYRVPSLTIPSDKTDSIAEVEESEAATLFVDRARQVRPNFRIQDEDVASVVEICRRLDGIPLAIELAAARTRMLQPSQIAEGLAQRFVLLTGGPRTAVPRQRTLEASVEWSYDLLSDAERLLLVRLTVFAGFFSLDAAEPVCSDDVLPAIEVLDLLMSLVDRSLVQAKSDGPRTRYRLLETVVAFARERLTVDDSATLRDRHLDYFVGVANQAQLRSAETAQAQFRDLDADLENLRAAMEWAMSSRRSLAVLEIVQPTYMYWSVRGHYVEMHQRLDEALSAEDIEPPARARALVSTSMLALMGGDQRAAYGYAGAAVPIADKVDEALGGEAHLYRAWTGYLAAVRGTDEIRNDLDIALERARSVDDDALLTRTLVFRGWIFAWMQSVPAGRESLEQGLREIEVRGVPFLDAIAHAFLAQVAMFDDDLTSAHAHARSALETSELIGYPAFIVMAKAVLAWVDTAEARPQDALRQVRDAFALVRRDQLGGVLGAVYFAKLMAEMNANEIGAAELTADALLTAGDGVTASLAQVFRGMIALERACLGDAGREFNAALERSRDPSFLAAAGLATAGLALTSAMSDELKRAWDLAHDALDICSTHGLGPGITFALEVLAIIAARTDRAELAARLDGATSARIHIARIPSFLRDEVDADVRATLGSETFHRCWAEGAATSLSDAVALARRGRGSRGRPASGWDSLTPTESQVVDLATEGLTNAAIAARLYVSPNTVKTHLTHVYDKLGISGRAELAAERARRG